MLINLTTFWLFLQDQEALTDKSMNLSTAEMKAILVEKYRWSEYATAARSKIKDISNIVTILLPTQLRSFCFMLFRFLQFNFTGENFEISN